jgi:hypothetical protein
MNLDHHKKIRCANSIYLSLSKIKHLFILNKNKYHMKINKIIFTGLGFITGTVFGISVIGFMSFTGAPAAPAPGSDIVAVSSDIARSYFTSYMSDAAPLSQVVKGFTVDRSQLEAMNSISRENPSLPGFRIYFGKDNNARKVAVVVGVDGAGIDAVKNTIFSTDARISSPCPPICDATSPIAGGN